MANMNTASSRTASQQITGEIQLARLRVAKAENQLKSAKQQARLARRRRKEAKQAARRAKKQVKLAKQESAEAEQALADAEAKLVRSQKRTTRTTKAARKAIAVRKKAARPAASASQKSVKPGVNQPTLAKQVSNAKPRVRKAAQPVAVARDFETPTATVSGGQALLKTEPVSGESPPGEAAAGSPVQSDRQAQ